MLSLPLYAKFSDLCVNLQYKLNTITLKKKFLTPEKLRFQPLTEQGHLLFTLQNFCMKRYEDLPP